MDIYLAELIGTAILTYFGCGVNAGVSLKGSYSNASGWMVICMGWGLAVVLAIYAVGSVSGAHINPAVTIGLAMVGSFDWTHVPGYVLAQMIGGVLGGTLVWLQYLPHWKQTPEQPTKLGVFSTSPAVPSLFANLLSETLGTFALLFGLMFIGANQFAEGLNPLVIGGLIVAIGVSLGGTTGWAINPARDLGPRIAHFILPIAGKGDSNWKYSWIPVIGPILGGIAGTLTYQAIFISKWTVAFWVSILLLITLIIWAVVEQPKQSNQT